MSLEDRLKGYVRNGARYIGRYGRAFLIGGVLVGATLLPMSYVSGAQQFIRGDVDQSGQVDLTDAVQTLNYLFLNGHTPDCLDSADANDDGNIDLTDAVYSLNYNFNNGPQFPQPHPNLGFDLKRDGLGCGDGNDLEARVIMQEGIPLEITESGIDDNNPLLYVLGEDIEADGIAIISRGNYIDLEGNGHELIYGKNGEANSYGIHTFGNHNVIHNFKVSQGSDGLRGHAIFLGGEDHLVEGNIVNTRGEESHDVYASGSSHLLVTGNQLESENDDSNGVFFNAVHDSEVDGNTIATHRNGASGIYFYNSRMNKADDNDITTDLASGFGVFVVGSDDNEFKQNKITTNGGFGHGFYLYGSSGSLITGNTIDTLHYNSRGAYLSGGSDDNTLELNLITTALSTGVYVERSLRLVARGNTITTSGTTVETEEGGLASTVGTGIYLYRESNDALLEGNDITTNGDIGPGIDVWGSSGLRVQGGNNLIHTYGKNSPGIISRNMIDSVYGVTIITEGEQSPGLYFAGFLGESQLSDSRIEARNSLSDDVYFTGNSQGVVNFISVNLLKEQIKLEKGSGANLIRNWYADAWVGDDNNNPMPNVLVEGYRMSDVNRLQAPLFSGYTDDNGRLERQILLGSTHTAQGNTYEGYRISASDDNGHSVSQDYQYGPEGNADGNIDARFVLPVGAN